MTLMTLKIRVEGRSFWVDRGAYFDVLFPTDGLPPDNAEHHYVTIDGPGFVATNSLTDRCLDLYTTLHPVVQPFAQSTSLDQPGWIHLDIDPASPAANPNTAITGKGLVAAMRLPRGEVAQLPGLGGPFMMGSGGYAYLGWGVEYFCVLDVATLSILGQYKPFASKGPAFNVAIPSPSTGSTIELTVKCLSSNDRRTPNQPLPTGSDLNETEPLFLLAGQPFVAPKFVGTMALLPFGYTTLTGIKTNGEKPCPAGQGVALLPTAPTRPAAP